MEVTFLCGCQTKNIIARENIATMSMTAFDADGFLVCALHHQRRQGWRSLPKLPGLNLANWDFSSWSPLEREAYFVFNEPLPERTVRNIRTDTEDRRDNRDPAQLARVDHFVAVDPDAKISSPPFGVTILRDAPRHVQPFWRTEPGSGSKVLPWPHHNRERV